MKFVAYRGGGCTMDIEINFYKEVYKLVQQVPEGKITTYGAIAEALGDIIAAKAVGRVLNQNHDLEKTPCYRVVRSNGKIGGYKCGKAKKKRLLRSEGVQIQKEQIRDFEKRLFRDFKADNILEKLKKRQKKLADHVIVQDQFNDVKKVAGVDVSYQERYGYGTCVVLDTNLEVVEMEKYKRKMNFPYIPTFFSFRELPVVKPTLDQLDEEVDLVFVGGNGLIHPRLGFASHLGIIQEVPTIGIAKNLLCGKVTNEPKEKGAKSPVYLNDQIVGYALKTSKRANPVYVSPGYKVSLDSACKITLDFSKYKLPAPIRRAHKESNKYRSKGES